MVLLSGLSNPELAKTIAKYLKSELHFPTSRFSDGELYVQIDVSVTNKQVFIIQPTCRPTNDNIMELLLICNACSRAGAKEIIPVMPYYGYSRQDRKGAPRVPISSAVVAKALKECGATRLITLDIHSEQQQGFFDGPWDNLYASYVLVPKLKKVLTKKLVVVSPDKGGVPRARAYAKFLNCEDVAIIFKERDTKTKNQSEALFLIGDVSNKTALIVDDIMDTAGTMVNAARMLKKSGANKVILAVTHGIFSGKAVQNLLDPAIDLVYCTDSIPISHEVTDTKKVQIISIAGLLAETIEKTRKGQPLASDLIL